jgi:hypothetical protein
MPTHAFSAARYKLCKLISFIQILVLLKKMRELEYSIMFIGLYISIADVENGGTSKHNFEFRTSAKLCLQNVVCAVEFR